MCDQQFAPGDYVGRTVELTVRYGDSDALPVGRVKRQPAEQPHHVVAYFPHPQGHRVPGGWILPCQREYRICDLVPATEAQFQRSTGDLTRLAAERDQHIARAATAEIHLSPEDFIQVGDGLYVDGMAASEWIEAMTAD